MERGGRKRSSSPFYRVTKHGVLVIEKHCFCGDIPLLEHKNVGHVAVIAKKNVTVK